MPHNLPTSSASKMPGRLAKAPRRTTRLAQNTEDEEVQVDGNNVSASRQQLGQDVAKAKWSDNIANSIHAMEEEYQEALSLKQTELDTANSQLTKMGTELSNQKEKVEQLKECNKILSKEVSNKRNACIHLRMEQENREMRSQKRIHDLSSELSQRKANQEKKEKGFQARVDALSHEVSQKMKEYLRLETNQEKKEKELQERFDAVSSELTQKKAEYLRLEADQEKKETELQARVDTLSHEASQKKEECIRLKADQEKDKREFEEYTSSLCLQISQKEDECTRLKADNETIKLQLGQYIHDLQNKIKQDHEDYRNSMVAKTGEFEKKLWEKEQQSKDTLEQETAAWNKEKAALRGEANRFWEALEASHLSLREVAEREQALKDETEKLATEISKLEETHRGEIRKTTKTQFDLGMKTGEELGRKSKQAELKAKEAELEAVLGILVQERSDAESHGYEAGKKAGLEEGLNANTRRQSIAPGRPQIGLSAGDLSTSGPEEIPRQESGSATDPVVSTDELSSQRQSTPEINYGLQFGGEEVNHVLRERQAPVLSGTEHHLFNWVLEKWKDSALPDWLHNGDLLSLDEKFQSTYTRLAEELRINNKERLQEIIGGCARASDVLDKDYRKKEEVAKLKTFLATVVRNLALNERWFKRDVFVQDDHLLQIFEYSYLALVAYTGGSILSSNQRVHAEAMVLPMAMENTSVASMPLSAASQNLVFNVATLDLTHQKKTLKRPASDEFDQFEQRELKRLAGRAEAYSRFEGTLEVLGSQRSTAFLQYIKKSHDRQGPKFFEALIFILDAFGTRDTIRMLNMATLRRCKSNELQKHEYSALNGQDAKLAKILASEFLGFDEVKTEDLQRMGFGFGECGILIKNLFPHVPVFPTFDDEDGESANSRTAEPTLSICAGVQGFGHTTVDDSTIGVQSSPMLYSSSPRSRTGYGTTWAF